MIKASITAVMDDNHMATVEADGPTIELLAMVTSLIRQIAADIGIDEEMILAGIAYTLGQEDTEGMEQ